MISPDYATLADYERLGYNPAGYEEFITAKLHEVSGQLRSEATSRYYRIDARFIEDEDWAEAVKSVVCKIVQNLVYSKQEFDANIGTEYEGVSSVSYSSGANGYSESKSINFRGSADLSTNYIPNNALKALGINAQQITRETF